jgi:hypothetical protein
MNNNDELCCDICCINCDKKFCTSSNSSKWNRAILISFIVFVLAGLISFSISATQFDRSLNRFQSVFGGTNVSSYHFITKETKMDLIEDFIEFYKNGKKNYPDVPLNDFDCDLEFNPDFGTFSCRDILTNPCFTDKKCYNYIVGETDYYLEFESQLTVKQTNSLVLGSITIFLLYMYTASIFNIGCCASGDRYWRFPKSCHDDDETIECSNSQLYIVNYALVLIPSLGFTLMLTALLIIPSFSFIYMSDMMTFVNGYNEYIDTPITSVSLNVEYSGSLHLDRQLFNNCPSNIYLETNSSDIKNCKDMFNTRVCCLDIDNFQYSDDAYELETYISNMLKNKIGDDDMKKMNRGKLGGVFMNVFMFASQLLLLNILLIMFCRNSSVSRITIQSSNNEV